MAGSCATAVGVATVFGRAKLDRLIRNSPRISPVDADEGIIPSGPNAAASWTRH
jgi:hypothetical protein